jgi:hypothetical protein
MPVDDAKWRADELPQKGLIEFRNDSAHLRVIGQRVNSLENLAQQPLADLGHSLFCISEPKRLEIRQSHDHRPHEFAFFFGGVVVVYRLDHGDPTAAAGQQYWAVRFRRMLDHPPRIDLEVSERDDISTC